MMNDALARLEGVYAGLPQVPCNGCGICCVTPHMTLVEFAFLLRGVIDNLGGDAAALLAAGEMRPSGKYPGNFLCALQDEQARCAAHAWRPLACRLEGLPVLDRMGFREQKICPHICDSDMDAQVTQTMVEEWTRDVFALNRPFYRLLEEPYWVDALNLECWLAVLLDPDVTQPFFLRMRKQLAGVIDVKVFAGHYADRTGFARKLTLIDRFFAANEERKPEQALKCIRRIVHEFPRTGTHFREQGGKYFRLMKQLVRETKQGKRV